MQTIDQPAASVPPEKKQPKPIWLRKRVFDSARKSEVLGLLERLSLNTVCQGARCPNLSECFDRGTATFLILGPACTRACAFCSVPKGGPSPVDPDEPIRVAEAARTLNLSHVVVTSVTRDDLPDGGAGHFAATVTALRKTLPGAAVEILTPDFHGDPAALERIAAAPPDIFNHNLETVPRLYPQVRPQADYGRSLALLEAARAALPGALIKSGLMAGLGETREEMVRVLADLKEYGCDLVTLGQYLSPTAAHVPIKAFVTPEQFADYAKTGEAMGLPRVFAGPFVRSSYMAEKVVPDARAVR